MLSLVNPLQGRHIERKQYPTEPSPCSLSLRGTKCRGNPPEKERKICSVDSTLPGDCFVVSLPRKDK